MTVNSFHALPWGPSGPGGLTGPAPGGPRTLAQATMETETHFLTHLLTSLRRTLVHSLHSASSGDQGYQSLADQHLARALALGGGLGLARRIVMDLSARTHQVAEENAHGEEPGGGVGARTPARNGSLSRIS